MLPLPGTVITTITVQFGWGDPYKTSLSTATGRMSITHLPCLARSKGNARNRPLKPWPRCGNASRNGKAYGRRRAENRSTDGDAWNKSAGWKMVEVCHCFCRGSGGWVRVFSWHIFLPWLSDKMIIQSFGCLVGYQLFDTWQCLKDVIPWDLLGTFLRFDEIPILVLDLRFQFRQPMDWRMGVS